MDAMEKIVKNIIVTKFEDLPEDLVAITKKTILDLFGDIASGSSSEDCRILNKFLQERGGPKESTLAVFGGKMPVQYAAQANGAMCRAMELDDVINEWTSHPSQCVIPTAMAVSEYVGGVSGKEFVTAVALGQDLLVRLSHANNLEPTESGRYNIFKIFPPVATAAKLMNLEEDKMLSAMGLAYSTLVGDAQSAVEGAMNNFIHQGTVSKAAIDAVLMADAGIVGPHQVLEGVHGFYNAYEPDPDIDALLKDLGKKYLGTRIAIKFYTTTRAIHGTIDAAIAVVKENKIDPRNIEKATVRTNKLLYDLVGSPLERKQNPQSMVDAQYSIPYAAAAAMIRGEFFIDEIQESSYRDPKILELTRRITTIYDEQCENELAIGRVIIEITMKDGKTCTKQIETPKGSPENPAGEKEIIEKFKKNLSYSYKTFSQEKAEKIIETILNLQNLNNAETLPELLIADG